MLPSRSGISTEAISMYKVSAWTDNSDFMDQICSERIVPVINRKSEHHYWILHIRISLGNKFHLIPGVGGSD